jgi:opacity protein-like surface antigen
MLRMRTYAASAAFVVLLIPGPLLAADLPVKAAPAPQVAAVPASWTACYVGAQGGYGWTDWRDKDLPGAVTPVHIPWTHAYEGDPIVHGYSGKLSDSGWLGGFQFGCDKQYGQFVLGAVLDISWTSQSGKSAPFGISPSSYQYSADESAKASVDHFGTARVRGGVVHGNGLYYVTGGFAWAHSKLSINGEAFYPPYYNIAYSASDSAYHLGYAVGLGGEWLLGNGWSFGLEYLHLGFQSANYRFGTSFPNLTTMIALGQGTKVKLDADIVTAKLNFRF